MKRIRKSFITSMCLLTLFALFTASIRFIDVRTIGPEGSSIGFAGINGYFHNLTGVHRELYIITDWLGLIPIFVCMGFGILGLIQFIKRKRITKVDHDILALGGFYIVTVFAYILFENVTVNYRPVLIDGILEPSYPSSTTMLVMCVMPTAIMQFNRRIKNKAVRNVVAVTISAFIAFMVIGRLLSGVHWLTDILGGVLFSAGLVMMYYSAYMKLCDK